MLTPYQTEKNEEIYCFEDDEDERRRRKTKTKDENGVDRKRTEEGKKRFQNKCVSSQNKRMRKEEGATVDVLSSAILSPLPSLGSAGRLVRPFGSVLQRCPYSGKES